jgi:ubiquitin fusion degradation protein 1
MFPWNLFGGGQPGAGAAVPVGYGVPGRPVGVFEHMFTCRSSASGDKLKLENTGKIMLPQAALQQLIHMRIQYPMMFEVSNPRTGQRMYCGVQEFDAAPGFCYLPFWIMEVLSINELDVVCVKNVSLTLGTFVKLQPHKEDFMQLTNPKAVCVPVVRRMV